MTPDNPSSNESVFKRIHRELIDAYDEELEMEAEDRQYVDPLDVGIHEDSAGREARRQYFRELFRLQGELVKLQEWVVETRHKVVIVFEGRDAAGKGGVIKRITQRLNPRVCRVAALPDSLFERIRDHGCEGGALRSVGAGMGQGGDFQACWQRDRRFRAVSRTVHTVSGWLRVQSRAFIQSARPCGANRATGTLVERFPG
jgi:hypothetical protein